MAGVPFIVGVTYDARAWPVRGNTSLAPRLVTLGVVVDNAVALVQAYLRLNGYFTVSEYPVVATRGASEYRTATDLDVLAFRFPTPGQLVPARDRRGLRDENHMAVDPALGVPANRADMVVCEVKEGRAVLNQPTTDPGVLRATLVAFGCCPPQQAAGLSTTIIREGRAVLPNGHEIRLVVFASLTDGASGQYHVVSLRQVVGYLRAYIREHWDVLRHWDSKDPALGFLITLAKAEQGSGNHVQNEHKVTP